MVHYLVKNVTWTQNGLQHRKGSSLNNMDAGKKAQQNYSFDKEHSAESVMWIFQYKQRKRSQRKTRRGLFFNQGSMRSSLPKSRWTSTRPFTFHSSHKWKTKFFSGTREDDNNKAIKEEG